MVDFSIKVDIFSQLNDCMEIFSVYSLIIDQSQSYFNNLRGCPKQNCHAICPKNFSKARKRLSATK